MDVQLHFVALALDQIHDARKRFAPGGGGEQRLDEENGFQSMLVQNTHLVRNAKVTVGRDSVNVALDVALQGRLAPVRMPRPDLGIDRDENFELSRGRYHSVQEASSGRLTQPLVLGRDKVRPLDGIQQGISIVAGRDAVDWARQHARDLLAVEPQHLVDLPS